MATNTYVALDKVTVGTATPSVTFSAIGAGYTDLVIVFECFTTAAGARDVALRFNSDTGSNYSSTFLQGNGTSAVSARESSQTRMMIDYSGAGTTSATAEIGIVNIMNYSNATTNKTVLVRANRAGAGTDAVVGLWRNTAAITSVTLMFINGTDNFGVGSAFSLYGIKAEPAWAAKATGGTITNDVQYTYHTFLSSGTFTPSQTLSCDYLVVAGGGGGGSPGGGGGGYRTTIGASQFSASATAHTVTVGAGGATSTKGNNSVFSSITSTGGGAANAAGGSGGGGDPTAGSGNQGGYSPVEGYAGGNGATYGPGGGGGASAVGGTGTGATSPGVGGTGGAGASNSISGSAVTYAGGGGGSAGLSGGVAGLGGAGGGGRGENWTANNSVAGTANTGGGGGGGWANVGKAGGSGIVIIRYAN